MQDWQTQAINTPCGGLLKIATNKEYSAINAGLTGVVIGTECFTCPYSILCKVMYGVLPKSVLPSQAPIIRKAAEDARRTDLEAAEEITPEPPKKESKKAEPKKEPRKAAPKEKKTFEKYVPVVMFTGLPIGNLGVVTETEKEIVCETSDSRILIFDKDTGLQTNARNPRFANRINKEAATNV